MKIATMEIALTTLKSLSVIVIRSFVHGASPINIAEWSWLLIILFNSVHCLFTSSVAALYSDCTKISCQSPCFNVSVSSDGTTSRGIEEPSRLSSPSANFTPFTSDISLSISFASLGERFASARTMCVAFISNVLLNFSFALMLSKYFGRVASKL